MAGGMNFADAKAKTTQECIFTTHTPVEAGHDRFNSELMNYALPKFIAQLGVPMTEIMALGRVQPENEKELFCMTVLALKLSRAANAVSELHGQVSRHMWQALYPGKLETEVPIGHITNGIHLHGWMKGSVRKFWRKKLTDEHNSETHYCREKFGTDWSAAVNRPRISPRRGIVGAPLQIAPRTHRVRPPQIAAAGAACHRR
jgi:alpha-glucan phosphorylase-like protein